MKTYIKTWAIIIAIVNMVVFLYLSTIGGSIIRCNRAYEKVYPCISNVVVSSIDADLDSPSSHSVAPPVSHEPGLREVKSENLGSDLSVIMEILVGVNIILIGMAVLLYFVLLNMEERRHVLCSVFSVTLLAFIVGSVFACNWVYKFVREPGDIVGEVHYNAPIIYLYDEQAREATVKLDLKGDLTCTYPLYDEETGWVVKTSPDGVLTDENGRQYEYLYWEADVDMVPDFSKGFCVRGKDSAAFLEKALADLGLSDTEANTFIMYWLPQLEENPYNVIAFQNESYEAVAKLDVDPLPDTVVRVNMLFYGSDEYVEIVEQDLTSMNPDLSEREGFVLVEWGGGRLG